MLRAEKWVPGGYTLARNQAGKIILLRDSIPEEQVRAEYQEQRKKISIGAPVEIIRPSPDRVTPDCPQFRVCGGCDWLHLAPSAHAQAKWELVADALVRTAKLPQEQLSLVRPTLQAAKFARARRRIRVKVDANGHPGFHALGSHRLVPIHESCQAIDPLLERTLAQLAQEVRLPEGVVLQLAVDDQEHVSLAVHSARADVAKRISEEAVRTGCVSGALALVKEKQVTQSGDPVLRGELASMAHGGPYASDAATFTQATRFGGEAILQAVCRAASEIIDTDDFIKTPANILELFAGAGHLTIPLLQLGASVCAVEGDERAFAWLQKNVQQAGQNAQSQIGRFFIDPDSLSKFMADKAPTDILVVDPPRTGIVGFHDILTSTKPKSLIMVSCDPATGARDLRVALDAGFTLDWLLPIDAFPRTSHVEWVAKLQKEMPWAMM